QTQGSHKDNTRLLRGRHTSGPRQEIPQRSFCVRPNKQTDSGGRDILFDHPQRSRVSRRLLEAGWVPQVSGRKERKGQRIAREGSPILPPSSDSAPTIPNKKLSIFKA